MADEAVAEDIAVTFHVKSSNDAKYTLTLSLSSTVLQLKGTLSTAEFADIAPDRQRLIYSGRVLKDDDTLGSYKIKEGHTIHLVKGAASNQRRNPASQGATASAAPAVADMATGPGANNMLAGLTGARYAGHANLPNANMFGPDGGMGPPPDPEQILSMLENPQFASTINEALSNPQVVETMIQQNPMLRNMGPEMRQMMQSPEFRRMMTDPAMMRQTMQMQRMMGGGEGSMFGGGGQPGGTSNFPAPGVTDTTPTDDAASPGAQPPTGTQPPNPFAAFTNPAAGGNPFAQLFAQGNPPTAGTPPTGTDPAAPSAQNRFADMANSPLFQNPQLMTNLMNSMYPPAGGAATATGTAATDPAAQQAQLAAMIQAMGGAGGPSAAGGFNPYAAMGQQTPAAPADTRPPEERYEEQLRQLNDMGFYEFERNVEALRRTGGSVQGAVEYLLTH